MKTVTELLTEMALGIVQAAKDLFLTHSRLKQDEPHPTVIVLGGDHFWQPRSVEGSRIQSKLRDDYERFHALLGCLLRTRSSSVQRDLRQASLKTKNLIDQKGITYISSGAEAFKQFEGAIGVPCQMLEALFDGAEGEHIYVSDTNALIYNTQIEDWCFTDSPRFVLLLMPTVLSELDQLKVTGKVESVREKAQKLARQCMEYRRRGDLNEGVVLRKDRHRLRTIAVEPDFKNSLPWLEPNNNDDRILAGFVEAMRQHPRCPVILVTGC
jgi:hypothetical protein